MANECKFQRLEEKVSFDDGQTWESQAPPVYHKGGLVEPYSLDCSGGGDINERWTIVDGDYLCDGYNKYKKEILEVSYDGGVTWYPSYPLAARLGEFVEYDEQYCAYAAEIHYWVNGKYGCPFGCPSGYECRLVNGRYDCYKAQSSHTPSGNPRYPFRIGGDPLKIVKCPNDILTSSLLASDPYDIFYLRIGQCAHEIADRAVQDKVYFEYLDTTDAISLTRIGSYAFYGCSGLTVDGEQLSSGLTNVTVPSGVTDIGEYAFYGCSALTDVVISNAPCSIGRYAFEGCTSLSGLTLGNSYTSIGYGAFEGCANITSNITIPSTVTSIGGRAFSGCSGITNITIQEGVTSIGSGAFNDTSITDLTIPNSVSGNITSNSSPFPIGCQYLTGVTIGSGITSAITDYFAVSPVSYLSLNCSTVSRRSTSQMATLPFEHVILGDNVSNLNQNAFYEARQLTTVEIGSGITSISEGAFTLCTSLTSINIPSSVTSIGNYGFWSCRSLTSIDIPSGVTSIGESAFRYCSGLTSITVEATTPPTLGNYAFDYTNDCPIYVPADSLRAYQIASGWRNYASRLRVIPKFSGKWLATYNGGTTSSAECDSTSAITNGEVITTNLTTIEIGKCVTSVGENAFQGCSSLTSIDLPFSIASIGSSTFENCTSLTSITCLATTPPTLGSHTFDNTSNCPIYVLPDSLSAYQTASGWSDYASRIQAITFKLLATYSDSSISRVSCNDNTTLTSGETMTIPSPISAMTSANIGDCVTSIGQSAFTNCTSLTSVTIPNSVTSIGSTAFTWCTSLSSIDIPNSVTSVGESAFAYCGSLTSIDIPSGVTYISYKTFQNCTSLTSVTIPNGVTGIGGSAFNQCRSLTSITIPNSVTTIGSSAFEYCSGVTSIDIPSGVTSINNGVFQNCTSLTSVTIPDSVTYIGQSAFRYCSGLTSVTIPNRVITISQLAFFGCSGLTSIDIPSSVTYIGERAFQNCSGLISVAVDAVTPPTLVGNNVFAFTQIPTRGYIYVPSESVDTYKAASGWSNYASRIRSNATKLVATYSDSSVVKIYCNSSSILSTGDTMNLPNPISAMTSASIGSCVTTIGQSAFADCISLTSCTIDSGLTTIGQTAFYGCTSLTSINIPSGVTSISGSAFSQCSSLTNVVLPNSVTSIGTFVFNACSGLTSINIPSGITSISDGAFNGCSSLTSITIPDSATSIGFQAFGDCSSLESVDIPSGVTSIGNYGFGGCSSLTSITIPNNVTSIDHNAFWGCRGFTSVTCLATTPPTLATNVFYDTNNCPIYVPADSLSAYQSASGWSDYASRLQAIT